MGRREKFRTILEMLECICPLLILTLGLISDNLQVTGIGMFILGFNLGRTIKSPNEEKGNE